jgi:hypothetical protein
MDVGEILKRGRMNDRSALRKIVAALSHRTCGIPIKEIARFYGIGSSSVSRMLDDGERLVNEKKLFLKQ